MRRAQPGGVGEVGGDEVEVFGVHVGVLARGGVAWALFELLAVAGGEDEAGAFAGEA